MNKLFSYGIIYAAYFFCGASLLAFGVFLFAGSFQLFNLGFGPIRILFMDAVLSLLFFVQHSVMVRRSFRRNTEKFLPEGYYPAVYAIVSGIVLSIMLLFWQKSSWLLGSASGLYYWWFRFMFIASVAGFAWGNRSLSFFDPLGVKRIFFQMKNKPFKSSPFSVRGPYKLVRHPLYFSLLVMMWAIPDLTADRLLFNVLWTSWIVIGSFLEEKDLVEEFGDDYKEYQRNVPMLLPFQLRMRYIIT
jgi:methanethiol S-methyltransferase